MALRVKRYTKKSPYWIIRGTVQGVRVHETSGTTVKRTAEKFAAKLANDIENEQRLGIHPPVLFSEAAQAYKNRGGETKYLLKLNDYFGDKPLSEIGQIEIDDAATALFPGARASTINRSLISPFITILRAAKRAWPKRVDLIIIDRRSEDKPVVTPADDDHIAKLLPFCSEGLAALITLMTYTGLRTGEALRVKQEDCKDGYVRIGITKNGEPRRIPAPHQWAYPNNGFGFETTQGVGRALRAASRAANIVYRDGHELGRHAFAARWLASGNSIKGLKEAGGWKKLAVVDQSYGHLEQTAVHEVMRELSRKK